MNMFQQQIITLICGKECQICMERRHLQQFCDNHSFCHSCCKEWSETSVLCPCCREKCTNKKYLTYDYTVLNTDYEFFKENYEYHLNLEHHVRSIYYILIKLDLIRKGNFCIF